MKTTQSSKTRYNSTPGSMINGTPWSQPERAAITGIVQLRAAGITLCVALCLGLGPGKALAAISEEIRETLNTRRSALMAAIESRDANKVGQVFTSDAKFMLNGLDTILGRTAIQGVWQAAFDSGSVKALKLAPADIEGAEDHLIVETGLLTTTDNTGKAIDAGKYLLVWKREEGEWKIFRDMANSNPSKPAKSASAATQTSTPVMLADRVGFPTEYLRQFKLLGVTFREAEPRVISVFGNSLAAAVTNKAQLPYSNGAILVMEWANATRDRDGKVAQDAKGNPIKGPVDHLDVMRRDKGFGEAYGTQRAGEWEFAGYRPDGSYSTSPTDSTACAACHAAKAGAANDFVFRIRVP